MVARALTRAKRPVGNVAYLHHSDADGRCVRGNRGQLLPTTVIAKKRGPQQYGVMVPNPYWDFGATLAAAAQATPWARRDSRPFWRGSLRRPKRGCEADSGNYVRFLAMTLTVGHPRHFDVKATSMPPAYANESLLRRQACVDLDGVLGRARVPHILANLDRALDTQIREDAYYTKFKMLVHLPGSTTGSYSRNLNKLWACGSVVLYWNHSAYEHYYAGLEDGRTHLIVNVTTAKDAAERVLSDEALAARLRQGAADVQRDLVCAECLSDYLVETLRTLRSHHRGDLSFDTRESLRETLNGVNCTALDLREFAAGRRHVPSPIPPASTAPAAHEDPACLALVNIAFPPRTGGGS